MSLEPSMQKASDALDACCDICTLLDYKEQMEDFFTKQLEDLQAKVESLVAQEAGLLEKAAMGSNPYTVAAAYAQDAMNAYNEILTLVSSIQTIISNVQNAQSVIMGKIAAKYNELTEKISDPVSYCKNR